MTRLARRNKSRRINLLRKRGIVIRNNVWRDKKTGRFVLPGWLYPPELPHMEMTLGVVIGEWS
jgi:hypothetical protein